MNFVNSAASVCRWISIRFWWLLSVEAAHRWARCRLFWQLLGMFSGSGL